MAKCDCSAQKAVSLHQKYLSHYAVLSCGGNYNCISFVLLGKIFMRHISTISDIYRGADESSYLSLRYYLKKGIKY